MRSLLIALVFLAAPAARAQLIPSFGAAAGVNFASLGDAATVELDGSTGYHVGIYADLGVAGLSVRPGLFYVRAGSLLSNDESVDYVSIPVDFKAAFPSPVVSPYAVIGPEFRFPQSSPFDANTRDFALAANLGVGVEAGGILLPNAFAELRYGLDLSGLQDDDAVDESVKVNLFMIRVGVGI